MDVKKYPYVMFGSHCAKFLSRIVPPIAIQPQPWDLLAVYDDPSYVDETIDAPYMKEVEKQQQ